MRGDNRDNCSQDDGDSSRYVGNSSKDDEDSSRDDRHSSKYELFRDFKTSSKEEDFFWANEGFFKAHVMSSKERTEISPERNKALFRPVENAYRVYRGLLGRLRLYNYYIEMSGILG